MRLAFGVDHVHAVGNKVEEPKTGFAGFAFSQIWGPAL